MKIAFLVLGHANPQQLSLLSETLSSDVSDVYIHFDKKSPEDLSQIKDAILVPRIEVFHGGFSVVQATLNLIRSAIQSNYDYYFLLSGQCFPTKPISWLQKRLLEGGDFINFYPMPRDAFAKRLDRLEYFYFERHTESRYYRLLNYLAKKLPKRNFISGLSLWPYAGSQWWCLRRETIEYILQYIDKFPAFVEYLSMTSYSDEVFFQSIISNMGIEKEIHPALFCADFDPITNRPKIYTINDVELLDLRETFCARKMDVNVDKNIIEHYRNLIIN